jgi:hypothetical protein
MIVTTNYFDSLVVAAAVANVSSGNFSGPLHGALVNLAINQRNPTKNDAVSDWTPPTYADYAAVAATFGAAFQDANGNIGSDSALVSFQQTSTITNTLAYGYYVTDSTGDYLLFAEQFATPVSLTSALSLCAFVIEWVASNAAPGQATLVAA